MTTLETVIFFGLYLVAFILVKKFITKQIRKRQYKERKRQYKD